MSSRSIFSSDVGKIVRVTPGEQEATGSLPVKIHDVDWYTGFATVTFMPDTTWATTTTRFSVYGWGIVPSEREMFIQKLKDLGLGAVITTSLSTYIKVEPDSWLRAPDKTFRSEEFYEEAVTIRNEGYKA